MILAAAVKFSFDNGGEAVLCAARHGQVFAQLKELGFEPQCGYKEICQGFIDHKNNFLTRAEAYEHAKMCGQISSSTIHRYEDGTISTRELFSEDLW